MTKVDPVDKQLRIARELATRLVEEAWESLRDSVMSEHSENLDEQAGLHLTKSCDGRVVQASPGLRERFFPSVGIAEIDELELPADGDGQFLKHADEMVIQYRQAVSLRFTAKAADGSAIRLITNRMPLVNADNEVIGVLCSYSEQPVAPETDMETVIDIDRITRKFDILEPRERDLAQRLSCGAINKQLAGHFGVSVRSIENWRRILLTKLGVETIADLTRLVVRFEDFGLMKSA